MYLHISPRDDIINNSPVNTIITKEIISNLGIVWFNPVPYCLEFVQYLLEDMQSSIIFFILFFFSL